MEKYKENINSDNAIVEVEPSVEVSKCVGTAQIECSLCGARATQKYYSPASFQDCFKGKWHDCEPQSIPLDIDEMECIQDYKEQMAIIEDLPPQTDTLEPIEDWEKIVKNWLKIHREGGEWVSDYNGEYDLDSCCLDGIFDLRDLCEQIIKSQSSKIKQEMIKEIELWVSRENIWDERNQKDKFSKGALCARNRMLEQVLTIINNSN